jgi:anti-sigma regulatory factor (Ser/Thr protein kinase)
MTFRKRLLVIIIGLCIGVASLWFTNNMARQLREKERYEVQLWSYAMERGGVFNTHDKLVSHILNNQSIPFVITDGKLEVLSSQLIPEKILKHPDRLRRMLEKMSMDNEPLRLTSWDGTKFYIFYGESHLLKMLTYFPFILIVVLIIFASFGYITFRSSKQDEQNRVWIGMAKETAHQLGTPTSSLLGWIEYLRSQPIDQTAVDDMSKDLTRLMKVADRFSKIGSETKLAVANINEVVADSVLYFRTRIPKNVRLDYNGLAIAPVKAMINSALFEWVVENLLKNALDAMPGKGDINVKISSDENNVYIDVSDTGKGIAKNNFKRIFEPGYTTKTRGWGLGLSLSKRIIDTYHNGRIWVAESEAGVGTTMRIALKRVYD